jgi:glyoxylase-like metal-dependent hydrolase (beta-lactamase superfamily II)
MTRLREVARDVYVLRHPKLDVNSTLIVGGHSAAIVDTLSTVEQATALLAEVKRVTDRPLVLVNTHAHFDHFFGNGTLASAGTEIWAHEAAARAMVDLATVLKNEAIQAYARRDEPFSAELAAVEVVPANRSVHRTHTLDLGDREITMSFFGRAHSDGDLVLRVPDADAVLAGDLIEQGASPQFGDGYPLDWPDVAAQVRRICGRHTVVIPGHGEIVDRAFVGLQHDDLSQLAWLIREGHADGAPAEAVAAASPFDLASSLIAVKRGYAELDGALDS